LSCEQVITTGSENMGSNALSNPFQGVVIREYLLIFIRIKKTLLYFYKEGIFMAELSANYAAAIYLTQVFLTNVAPKRQVVLMNALPVAAEPCLKTVSAKPFSSFTVPYSE